MTGDMLKKLVKKTSANFPMQQNINTGEVGKLWMDCFGDKDDGLMETALTMILADAKFWPTVKDIKDAITELTTVNYSSTVFKQLDKPPENRLMSSAAKMAFESVKNSTAKEYLANLDIGDIKDYVRERFPDTSDSFIRQNYNELAFAAEFNVKCEFCKWSKGKSGCETNGYYPVPRLEKKGYIRIEYAPCVKRKGV